MRAYEKVEKVFFVTDDIVGYTIALQHTSNTRTFVLYSLSQRKEVYKVTDTFNNDKMAYQFLSSGCVVVKNGKTPYYDYKVKKNKYWYQFYISEIQKSVVP